MKYSYEYSNMHLVTIAESNILHFDMSIPCLQYHCLRDKYTSQYECNHSQENSCSEKKQLHAVIQLGLLIPNRVTGINTAGSDLTCVLTCPLNAFWKPFYHVHGFVPILESTLSDSRHTSFLIDSAFRAN